MKGFTIATIFILISFAGGAKRWDEDNLPAEIHNAKLRLRSDFVDKLWLSTCDTIANTQYNMLKLYSQSTLDQAQHVVDYIAGYTNLTRSESASKRIEAVNTKKRSIAECAINGEIATLKAYKITGYNLHNCIRSAQITTETKYGELVGNFEMIKNAALRLFDHYTSFLNNCIDTTCVMSTLIRSVVQYEKLQEELSGNVTEVNNLSSRYMMTNIAMGCVANSLTQVYDNYNIGKRLVSECFLPQNRTVVNNTTSATN